MEWQGDRLIPATPEVPMPVGTGTGRRALGWGVAAAIVLGLQLRYPLGR